MYAATALDLKSDPPLANRSVIAKLLGVDQATVEHYQNEGMPYIDMGLKHDNLYIIPVCVNWFIGREIVQRTGLHIDDPLLLILVSHSYGMEGETVSEWRKSAWQLTQYIDISRDDFDEAFAHVRGLLHRYAS